MPEEGCAVRKLVTEGRFREATADLRNKYPQADRMSVASRLLFAELLERTGRLSEARTHLAALKRSAGLSEMDRARMLVVEGLLAKQMGHLQDSISAFQKAYRMAERIGSPELLCWCQLRMLGVSSDLDGTEPENSHLSDLRQNVERAASPLLSIAYQIFLAELNAKRGRLDTSRHHTNLAESLLSSFPNVWLRGLLALHVSCLNYLEGNFLDSLLAARDAFTSTDESGHLLTRLIAQADMAAAYLAVGQPARARSCLASALQQSSDDEQIFGLLLETLAEAQLLSGDLEGCAESLNSARNLSNRLAQSRSKWHKAWNLRTQVRLLQRRGLWH